MSTNTEIQSTTPDLSNTTGVRGRRAIAVGASTGAAAFTWIIASKALGIDVRAPSFDPANPATEVGIGSVIASTAVSSFLGWALLTVLERVTARSMAIWTAAAVTFAVVSLSGPLSGTGVSNSQRLVLVVFHLVVAAVYVPLMRRSKL